MALKTASGFNTPVNKLFVDRLIDKGLLKPGFKQFLDNRTLTEIGEYLLVKKILDEKQIAHEYADFFGLSYVDIIPGQDLSQFSSILPLEVAKQYCVIAYKLEGLDLYLAVGKPSALQQGAPKAIADIRSKKGLRLHLAVAPESQVKSSIASFEKLVIDKSDNKVSSDELNDAGDETKTEIENSLTSVHSINKKDLLNEVEPRNKFVDLKMMQIPTGVIQKIPKSVAQKYGLVVFDSVKQKSELEPALIKVAALNPDDPHVKEILTYITQRNHILIDKYTTDQASFDKALLSYGEVGEEPGDSEPSNNDLGEVSKVTTEVKLPVAPAPQDTATKGDLSVMDASPVNGQSDKAAADPGTEKKENSVISYLSLNQKKSVDQTDKPRASEEQNGTQQITQEVKSPEELATIFKQGMVPQIVRGMLALAIKMLASDIHIEAEKEAMRIRFRVDGVLHDILRVPRSFHAPLISRIKILSKMKIDEQRVPQDGRFDVVMSTHEVDLRVSTMPTIYGEKVVIRLLDKSEGIKTLEQLGVTGTNFDSLIKAINKPYGIVLATGPTGSGKSTTLYAVLSRISKPGVNIVTLEDPVEYELTGINQAQVKPDIGFSFAEGLRSVLRQDPNVIMVGEIRDLETAAMATQAALTGHLVLSTLHTNDAAGALPRLIDMGVEPFLITSSINAVLGQRLVRKICDNCREEVQVPPAVKEYVKKELAETPTASLQNINAEELTFYHGRGCDQCTNGFRGRMGIYEVLPMTEAIEELAIKKVAATDIQKQAVSEGMMTMAQDGLLKALKGITTIDEVLRVTSAAIETDGPLSSKD